MRIKSLVFGIFVLLLVSTSTQAMVGGVPALPEQTNGIVGLSYNGDSINNCIGVLLQADRVLTTAKCTQSFNGAYQASDIRVHPLTGSEIGGSFLIPTLNEDVIPFVGVSSYTLHPNNISSFGPYNLAVLQLSQNLSINPVKLYGGSKRFVGESGDAFGWLEVRREGQFLTRRFYQANVLTLPRIVEADANASSIDDGCYDNFTDTDTVFCAGFRNTSKYLESFDEGAPMFKKIGQEQAVIGLLSSSSGGFELEGKVRFEQYARLSEMRDFIVAQAPNTQFVDGEVEEQSSINLPAILLLLAD